MSIRVSIVIAHHPHNVIRFECFLISFCRFYHSSDNIFKIFKNPECSQNTFSSELIQNFFLEHCIHQSIGFPQLVGKHDRQTESQAAGCSDRSYRQWKDYYPGRPNFLISGLKNTYVRYLKDNFFSFFSKTMVSDQLKFSTGNRIFWPNIYFLKSSSRRIESIHFKRFCFWKKMKNLWKLKVIFQLVDLSRQPSYDILG